MSVSALIVGAGRGERLGGGVPKQYQAVGGRPIIFHTLSKFEDCPLIDEVVIVVAPDWVEHVKTQIVAHYKVCKVTEIVEGGEHRQDSVYAGLQRLSSPPEIVVIHDAVRPFVSVDKISESIRAAQKNGAAVLAVPPRDTIKTGKDGFIRETLDRSLLWAVQTPQTFHYDLIMRAYEFAYEHETYSTDDAALVEAVGSSVEIVEGEHSNIKITYASDLKLAEVFLESNQ